MALTQHSPATLTAIGFDFEWTASGAQTITHNFNVPTRLGKIAYRVVIFFGDAYVSNVTKDAFTVTATSAAGHGRFEADTSNEAQS